jgi:hypothetical protein
MIMTWPDYIYFSCGMSLGLSLVIAIAVMIVWLRDKNKK